MDIPSTLSLKNLPLLPNQFRITDPKDWNLIIKHHTKLNNDHAILTTYTHMESLGIPADTSTLPLVLKACARLNDVDRGRRIHSSIWNTGLSCDVRVGTALVDFYCRCGLIDDARKVFAQIGVRDVVLWNALIYGYVGCCYFEEAIWLLIEMEREGLKPNSRTVVALLLACREILELRLGQEIHGYCVRNGLFDLDPHVGTALIGFYLRFDVRISHIVFDLMVARNTVSWNAIITGYVENGEHLTAWKLFMRMLVDRVKFDSVTVIAIIQACAELGFLELGMQMHQMAIKSGYSNNLFVANALLNMYSESGSFELSCQLFDTIPKYDVALWNSMIYAYIGYGFYEEAMFLFLNMQVFGIRDDERTIAIMLSLCANLADGMGMGKSLHAHAIKRGMELDVSLGNAFLGMYAEQNCIEAARKVFTEIKGPDVISWNTLIMALACNKLRNEAWNHFEEIQASKIKPNSHTIISLLAACDDETCLNSGRAIHGFAVKHDIQIDLSLNTALTDMYMNCGDEATARSLFEACPNRDVISWNALISSYIKKNEGKKAQELFNRMISEVEPNSVTIINILSSYTNLAALPQGQCLHAYITRRHSSFGVDVSLANAFVTMYARCGSMQYAEKMFKNLPRKNIISWNALITGYGMHGRAYDAIFAFLQMLEDGLKPNGATFVAVLSACRHFGPIEEGLLLFHTMIQEFKITPELVHYGCVVDLLCRGGRINEAKEFIESMPIKPDATLWRALLSACRVNSDIELAGTIFEKLVEIEPMNAGNYVLLSNIYAAAGLWSEVRKVRKWLQEKGLRKPPGMSWIVVRSQVHYFTAGDVSHPQSHIIYENLYSLLALIKENGYIPDFHQAFQDEED
ncbi:pentatricopeptide repeat-containing protein At5g27110 [Ziziphus jujuba]|uniref:Pentatricopeptide repeat-containing protein At5g27110 n=1 Tax=Ziziphus jujuba TaxID=326968 RepID=A0A6P3ZQL4_ZIZJJ|nr:pentatricopeptide repeat-containing protein At5g27110 [Ziziphus jujuba]